MTRTVGSLLLVLFMAVPANAQSDAYLEMVAQARRGDPRGAVSSLLGWPPASVAAEIQTWPATDARCVGDCVRAATLLHTEAAVVSRFTRQVDRHKANLHAADALARKMIGPPEPVEAGAREFDRAWRLAVGYWHQEWGALQDALPLYEESLKKHPNDPETLVALGTLFEQLDAMPQKNWMHARSSFGPRPANWLILTATEYYERALAARPGHAEARLRLGRALRRNGRMHEAKAELRRALASTDQRELVGWAHCFLGEIDEQSSNPGGAIEHYKAAVAADPRLQPAQLGLSGVLNAVGRPAEALSVLRDGLETTRDGEIHSWYGYHTNTLHGFRATMHRLWNEVRE